jgi:hypothetical protein
MKAPILCTVDLDGTGNNPILHQLDLSTPFPPSKEHKPYIGFLSKQTLYISNQDLIISVDIKNPDRPTISHLYENLPPFFCQFSPHGTGTPFQVELFPETKFSLSEQLDLALKLNFGSNTIVPIGNNMLFLYHRSQLHGPYGTEEINIVGTARFIAFEKVKDLRGFGPPGFLAGNSKPPRTPPYKLLPESAFSTKTIAMFDMTGTVLPSPLESLWEFINTISVREVLVHQGFAYAREHNGLRVYDLRRPEQPRSAGHFALGQWISAMAPLAEGRILVASGNNLYVLAPPK